jgi:very-short-patch-repair endonuclease
MPIAGEEMQCDFVWHRHRLVVEVDGWETHRTRRAFKEDRRRDRVLRMAGWEPLRFTSDDITKEVDHVAQVLAAAIGLTTTIAWGTRPYR